MKKNDPCMILKELDCKNIIWGRLKSVLLRYKYNSISFGSKSSNSTAKNKLPFSVFEISDAKFSEVPLFQPKPGLDRHTRTGLTSL